MPVVDGIDYPAPGPLGTPFSSWTVGAPMNDYRELQFGPYLFTLAMQERNNEIKFPLVKKKIPFTPGDFNPANSSLGGRTTEFYGTVGSGEVGFSGAVLQTQNDVELERNFLSGLQVQGQQQLWTRPDRYLMAWLEDWTYAPMESGSFRFADWTAKFYAQDPRLYGGIWYAEDGAAVSRSAVTNGPYTDNAFHKAAVSHIGNTKAFPTITFSGACQAPQFWIQQGSPTMAKAGPYIGLQFSKLTMAAGDTLTIACDPRPDTSQLSIIYTPVATGIPTNGYFYIAPADYLNTLDFQFFLPYIDVSYFGGVSPFTYGLDLEQTIWWAAQGTTDYSVTVQYQDTWV